MQNRPRLIFRARSGAVIIGIILGALAVSAQATTRTVTKLADTNDGVCDADCSLREAIATSAAGDSIVFAPALNGGQINLANAIGPLVIGRNLTIVGPDGGLTINGDQSFGHRLLRVTAGTVSISDCTISNGYEVGSAGMAGSASSSGGPGGDGLGGGILNSGTLTLIRCRVLGNRIYGGPGGNGYAATTTYSYGGQGGSAFGGGIYNEGTLTLIESTLADNVAIGGFSGSCYAANKNAIQTPASGGGTGGGIYNKPGASLAMLRCTLDSNSAWGGPGTAGQAAGSGGDGGPGIGGGVYDNGTSSIANCTFNNNHALGGAGGARGPQSFDYDGDGGEGYGGGIAAKTVTLTNCTLSGNTGSGGPRAVPQRRWVMVPEEEWRCSDLARSKSGTRSWLQIQQTASPREGRTSTAPSAARDTISSVRKMIVSAWLPPILLARRALPLTPNSRSSPITEGSLKRAHSDLAVQPSMQEMTPW